MVAAQIDEAHLRANGKASDHGAFDDRVGAVQEAMTWSLAGARLGFVAVDEDVLWLFGLLGDEGPLHAGRETSSAAAAKAGGLHGVDDPFGTLGDGLLNGLVAVKLEVLLDICSALTETAGDDFYFIGMGDAEGWHRYFTSFPQADTVGLDNLIDLYRGEVVVEVVVDLHGRSPATSTDALNL